MSIVNHQPSHVQSQALRVKACCTLSSVLGSAKLSGSFCLMCNWWLSKVTIDWSTRECCNSWSRLMHLDNGSILIQHCSTIATYESTTGWAGSKSPLIHWSANATTWQRVKRQIPCRTAYVRRTNIVQAVWRTPRRQGVEVNREARVRVVQSGPHGRQRQKAAPSASNAYSAGAGTCRNTATNTMPRSSAARGVPRQRHPKRTRTSHKTSQLRPHLRGIKWQTDEQNAQAFCRRFAALEARPWGHQDAEHQGVVGLAPKSPLTSNPVLARKCASAFHHVPKVAKFCHLSVPLVVW